MRWMVETQLGRRNLSPNQRITIAKKYEEKFRVQAKENLKTSTGGVNPQPISNRIEPVKETVVQKEIAKIANVGSGTVARYEVVMKSDDEELKEKA